MTGFEGWLLDNLLEVAVIVGGGAIAFMKLSGWTKRESKLIADTKAEFDRHLDEEYPHATCRVEKERFLGIYERLKSIDERLRIVDSRVVEILRNGRAHGVYLESRATDEE